MVEPHWIVVKYGNGFEAKAGIPQKRFMDIFTRLTIARMATELPHHGRLAKSFRVNARNSGMKPTVSRYAKPYTRRDCDRSCNRNVADQSAKNASVME